MKPIENGTFEVTQLLAEAKETEKNVDENANYKKEMELLKSTTLPTFVIEGEVYRGFDENIGKIMEVLGL
ncbi:TPA: hypothetical protein SUB30_004772 [Bacillus pseudomycoides]|nr:hypothetical protein [Bacillus pseudomycoides]